MPQRKSWLIVSAVLAVAYVGYVVWAKYEKMIGPPPVKLGETGEFLLFLAAVVAFSFQVFVEDRGDVAPPDKDHA
jgi:hypothetical protein